MIPFHTHFPDLAPRETRVAILPFPQGGVPAGPYAFIEHYCADPGCDCRRVLLLVATEKEPDTILATINYGWDSLEPTKADDGRWICSNVCFANETL